jgi:hypothetical protein
MGSGEHYQPHDYFYSPHEPHHQSHSSSDLPHVGSMNGEHIQAVPGAQQARDATETRRSLKLNTTPPPASSPSRQQGPAANRVQINSPSNSPGSSPGHSPGKTAGQQPTNEKHDDRWDALVQQARAGQHRSATPFIRAS